VPWTNNASEQAIKGPKRHQAVSGYWHSLATLARYCRLRSYLVTSCNHGIRPIDAIYAALSGRPWLPAPAGAYVPRTRASRVRLVRVAVFAKIDLR
jgi:transposase